LPYETILDFSLWTSMNLIDVGSLEFVFMQWTEHACTYLVYFIAASCFRLNSFFKTILTMCHLLNLDNLLGANN
jgi:hypothetical protein